MRPNFQPNTLVTLYPLLFGLLCSLAFLAPPAHADIQLDNTCSFGSKYIQMAGFACIESEERLRNPSWDGRWAIQGGYQIAAFKLINENMNRIGVNISNVIHCVNFTIVHSGCSGDANPGSFARSVSALWAQRSDFLISDFGSTLSLPNILEADAFSKIIFVPISATTVVFRCRREWMALGLQPQCSFDGQKRFPYAYSMLIPGEFQLNPVVTMYKLAGVKDIVFWNEKGVWPETVRDGILAFSEYSGIKVTNLSVPANPTQAHITSLVQELKRRNPDGVIAAAYTATCPLVIRALREANYFPKGLAESDCATDPVTKREHHDAIYTMDKTEYDRRMTGPSWVDDLWYPPTDTLSSAELVYRHAANVSNDTPHWSTPVTAAAGLVLHKVLEQVGSLLTEKVHAGISLFNQPSFIGQIGFSSWGQNNVKDVIVLQADQNFDLQIVYPLGSATANMIYPAPTFDERIVSYKYMGKVSEQVLGGFAGFFILVSVGLLIFVLIFYTNPIMRAATPLFMIAILIGSILMYGAYFTWVLQARTAVCHLRFWMLGIGFVLMFGALFSKTWRVMRIFTMDNLQVFRITNYNLLVVLACIIAIEAILLAIWSGTSQPKSIIRAKDPLRPSKNVLICSSGRSGKAMLGILVAYKLIMMLCGIYMSIRTWNVPLKQFNESRAIAFSMYNMLCLGVLAFALQVSGAISDPAMFLIRSIILMLSTFFTIIAIFVPKIIHLYTGHSGHTSSSNSGGPTPKSPGSSRTGANSKPRAKQADSSFESYALDSAKQERSYSNLEAVLENYRRRYRELKGRVKESSPHLLENLETSSPTSSAEE